MKYQITTIAAVIIALSSFTIPAQGLNRSLTALVQGDSSVAEVIGETLTSYASKSPLQDEISALRGNDQEQITKALNTIKDDENRKTAQGLATALLPLLDNQDRNIRHIAASVLKEVDEDLFSKNLKDTTNTLNEVIETLKDEGTRSVAEEQIMKLANRLGAFSGEDLASTTLRNAATRAILGEDLRAAALAALEHFAN